VRLNNLAEALSLLAISQDGKSIEVERLATDVSALELGSPNSGTNSLDNQISFQFSDRSDDHHDGSSQRASGIDLLTEADELDVKPVEIIQHIEEVAGGACDAIARQTRTTLKWPSIRQLPVRHCRRAIWICPDNLNIGAADHAIVSTTTEPIHRDICSFNYSLQAYAVGRVPMSNLGMFELRL